MYHRSAPLASAGTRREVLAREECCVAPRHATQTTPPARDAGSKEENHR
jgi:hypothetical protein